MSDCHHHDHSHNHKHGHHHHHHGEGEHHHSHTPTVNKDNESKVFSAFLLIFGFMFVEMIGGILSGSLALIADAGHMLTDAVALGLACLAFRLGRRGTDSKRTFGYGRFEVIAGFVNAVTLFAIIAWIGYEAVERFFVPQPILPQPMFWVAVTGLVVNLFVLWYLTRGDTDHVNVKGAILHVMGDLLGSVGAIIAVIVIWLTGWTPIDPILSLFVALLMVKSAWKLLKQTTHILLEGTPDNTNTHDIKHYLEAHIQPIKTITHIHVWMITSGKVLATLHIHPKEGVNLKEMVQHIEEELKTRFHIDHATIAIDWDGKNECSL